MPKSFFDYLKAINTPPPIPPKSHRNTPPAYPTKQGTLNSPPAI